jgi:steroid delta-isomerase
MLATRYIEALNSGDAETVIALFRDDATIEDPVGGAVRRGHTQIAQMYRTAFSRTLRVMLEIPPRGSYGDSAAYAFTVILPDTILKVIGILTFDENGLISSMRSFHGPSDRCARTPGP